MCPIAADISPFLEDYLLSYRALWVIRACVGCHDRCPITYILPLSCPTFSLIHGTCVYLFCSNVCRCLLSILFHSCRRHYAPCCCSVVFNSQSVNHIVHAFAHVFPHSELSQCLQRPHLPHTRCLLAYTIFLLGAIDRLLALYNMFYTDLLVDELTLSTR